MKLFQLNVHLLKHEDKILTEVVRDQWTQQFTGENWCISFYDDILLLVKYLLPFNYLHSVRVKQNKLITLVFKNLKLLFTAYSNLAYFSNNNRTNCARMQITIDEQWWHI